MSKMGCNYYLHKKCPIMQPPSLGCCDSNEKEPIKLTNGYVWNNTYYKTPEDCPGFYQKIHIGKSSYGWHFSLAIYPDDGINNLEQWKELFFNQDNEIYDDCGKKIPPEEMIDIITNRTIPDWDASPDAVRVWEENSVKFSNEANKKFNVNRQYTSYDDMLADNHAERGCNGLWKPLPDKYIRNPENNKCTYVYVISGNDPETGCVFC